MPHNVIMNPALLSRVLLILLLWFETERKRKKNEEKEVIFLRVHLIVRRIVNSATRKLNRGRHFLRTDVSTTWNRPSTCLVTSHVMHSRISMNRNGLQLPIVRFCDLPYAGITSPCKVSCGGCSLRPYGLPM